MAIDDDHYVLDDDGNRVLVGLDPKETLEFETLEKFFSVTDLMSRPSSDDRRSSKEQQRCTFSFSRGLILRSFFAKRSQPNQTQNLQTY